MANSDLFQTNSLCIRRLVFCNKMMLWCKSFFSLFFFVFCFLQSLCYIYATCRISLMISFSSLAITNTWTCKWPIVKSKIDISFTLSHTHHKFPSSFLFQWPLVSGAFFFHSALSIYCSMCFCFRLCPLHHRIRSDLKMPNLVNKLNSSTNIVIRIKK